MVNVRILTPEQQKKAIDELNEDPARIEKDLEVFREWIKKSPHIKGRTDDQFLIAFLRGCKFSLEKAKLKYDLHYTLKTHLPEACKNRDPLDEKTIKIIKCGVSLVLPKPSTPNTPRYFFARPGAFDPDEINADDLMKSMTMMYDALMMEDDDFVVSGVTVVVDASTATLKHFLVFNSPVTIKKQATLQQDAYPIRQKGMHMLKLPGFMVALLNLFRSFLNEKNKARMYVHGNDLEELYKIIPREILPKEYGGDAGTIDEILDDNYKFVLQNREFYLEDEQYGVDEKKRIGRSKNPETLFGVDGTFRQLQID